MSQMLKMIRFVLALLWLSGAFSGVRAQHDPPVVVNDTVNMYYGDKLWVNLLANDYDPDGLPLKLFNSPFAIKTDSSVFVDMSAHRYMSYAGRVKFKYIVRQYPPNGSAGRIGIGYLVVRLLNRGVDSIQCAMVKACISATNGQFSMYSNQTLLPGETMNPGNTCTYNYPAGGSLATFYTMSLWLGGVDGENRLHFSGERYRNKGTDFWSGPLSRQGDSVAIDSSVNLSFHRIWNVKLSEVRAHRQSYLNPGYVVPESIATWPAHGDTAAGQSRWLAPFVDVDGNGWYEPDKGDYPLIRGDQALWFILNDYRTNKRESGNSLPLGVELHCMAYVFQNQSDSAFANTVFFNYKLFNRSLNDYHGVYLGVFADFDIGDPEDDFVKCDVARGSIIGYNGYPIDGTGEIPGYGDNPPAQGVAILSGPLISSDGIDNQLGDCDNSINGSGFGDGKIDNERIGMSRFVYFNNGNAGYMSDPDSAVAYYNYMRGIWLDGSLVEYGGHGHYGTGAYGPSCRYMYPDESDPVFFGTFCEAPFGPVKWTEEIAGNRPGDRRGLASMGPVDLVAGGYQTLDLALVTGRGSNGQSSLGVLLSRIDSLRFRFQQNPDFFGAGIVPGVVDVPGRKEVLVVPNPATTTIQVVLPDGYETYTIRNQLGQVCKTGQLPPDGLIRIEELYSGFYVIAFEGTSHGLIARFLKF